jgi:pimeloyl-ACP methyl ester carboxylesterase
VLYWHGLNPFGVHLAARHQHRVRALALLDAGHTDIPGDPEQPLDVVLEEISGRQERYAFESWEEFLEAAKETRPNWRPALETQLRAGMRKRDGAVVARSDRRAAAAAWHGRLQEQPSSAHAALGETRLPVLLVLGSRNDTTAEVERFRDVVSQVDVRSVESGHDLLADAPEETIALVAEWLRTAL